MIKTIRKLTVLLLASAMLASMVSAASIQLVEKDRQNYFVKADIGTYNPGDIAVINNIIANNGLGWTPADPADGSYVPDDWTGVDWSDDVTDKRVIDLDISEQGITGSLDVSGLVSLQDLSCWDNHISSLPNLPAGLISLDIGYNPLEHLPDLPPGLTWLGINGLHLESLPSLPSGLTELYASDNNLTALPAVLPTELTVLCVDHNQLTSLPDLPPDLSGLNISGNLLSGTLDISHLHSLCWLNANNNHLTGLILSDMAFEKQYGFASINVSYNNMTDPSDVVRTSPVEWDDSNFIFWPQRPQPLPTPTGLQYDGDGFISWNPVVGAKWYFIRVDGLDWDIPVSEDEGVTFYDLKIELISLISHIPQSIPVQMVVKVMAVGGEDPWQPTHASEFCAPITVEVPVLLSAAPEISLGDDGFTLTWDNAPDSDTFYYIYVDGISRLSAWYCYPDNTINDLRELRLEPGEYEISIIAHDELGFAVSAPSNAVSYSSPVLPGPPTPTGLAISDGVLTWIPVVGAARYGIELFDEHGRTWRDQTWSDRASFDLRFFNDYISISEVYQVRVRALGDWESFSNSEYSDPISYIPDGSPTPQLGKPSNLQIYDSILTWDNVTNAVDYYIYVDGQYCSCTDNTMFDLVDFSLPDGSYQIQVMAMGRWGEYLDSDFSDYVIYEARFEAAPLVFNDQTLAGGTVGASYSANIAPATGGSGSYTYTLASGTLPSGLTLSAAGAVRGTPGAAVSAHTFVVRATDTITGAIATATFTITVVEGGGSGPAGPGPGTGPSPGSDSGLVPDEDEEEDIENGKTPVIDAPPALDNPFEDISEGSWCYDDVMYVYHNGLMTGTSATPMLFSPLQDLNRAMIVTILYRYENEPGVDGLDNPFDDVIMDTWYTDAVIWAAANGIVLGYEGMFDPLGNITRQDLAAILVRYADFKEAELPSVRAYQGFDDDEAIAEYAKDAVVACFEAGVINGKDGNIFDPRGNATRAEAAAMLHRFLLLFEDAPED